RRRRGDAARAGHDRLQRHDRCHHRRPVPDAGLLYPHPRRRDALERPVRFGGRSPMSGQAPDPRAAGAWAPLRSPAFRALWIGTTVANVGTWMHEMAAGWLMTQLTTSSFLIAQIG